MKTTYNVFNKTDKVIEGWYWVLRSDELKCKKAKAVTLMGRDLAVYRTDKGKAVILDAYCAHMGAHLAQGTVQGSSIRCMFHNWKYNSHGQCEEIPSLGGPCRLDVRVKMWPCEEQYGLIWIWTGEKPEYPVPCPLELVGLNTRSVVAHSFKQKCHPHVVLINAIDEHHFNSVHQLPVLLRLEPVKIHSKCIQFNNTTRPESLSLWGRIVRRFYKNALTYSLTYWNGGTGVVTVGPDFLHFYILFSLRPTHDGQTEGQTVLLTRQRNGVLGYFVNHILLALTLLVANFFAKGDTVIFSNIRFEVKTPIKPDHVILKFIQHLEQQSISNWSESEKTSELVQKERICEVLE